jgi:hypothetical protein
MAKRMTRLTYPAEEGPLSDQEIEDILTAENANYLEETTPAATVYLVESASSAASWVKWFLFIALASEFLVGWFRR